MRNVLISGASRGLGLAIANRLASDGFRAIAIARTLSDDLSLAMETAAAGPGEIHFHAADLSDLDGIAGVVRDIKGRFGPYYGLVNNAGISVQGILTNVSQARIEQVVRLNTLAPILLTKYAARSMIAQQAGRVVNMASIMGSTGYNGLSVYGATKASMIGFTRSLARELGRVGVTVNAVAPGFIDTDLTASMAEEDRARVARRSALGRLAEPCDVAAAVAFLMSDGARNITGTVLTVDAGSTA
jgi:3-oxoacyl-[acyl-carrier protein] reductase